MPGAAIPGRATTGQLENEVKRLIAFVRGKSITEAHLDTSILNSDTLAPIGHEIEQPPRPAPLHSTTLPEAVDLLERDMIEDALRKTGGNKQKAAQALWPEPPGVD